MMCFIFATASISTSTRANYTLSTDHVTIYFCIHDSLMRARTELEKNSGNSKKQRLRVWRLEKCFRSAVCNLFTASALWNSMSGEGTAMIISRMIRKLQALEGTIVRKTWSEASVFQIFLGRILESLENFPLEVLDAMLRQPYFKYVTFVAAVVIRLTKEPHVIWTRLGPLLNDYRNLIIRPGREFATEHDSFQRLVVEQRTFELVNMDILIFHLLHSNGIWEVFDIYLPHIPISHHSLDFLPNENAL
mmetsp:Transcript_29550/g.45680  ORF Transcript_29550/g.45680 Transcript_29550/m.45680 type:complete len:248 (+) Transcript_29550:934-1677(+)